MIAVFVILIVTVNIALAFVAGCIMYSLEVGMQKGMMLERYGNFVKDKFWLKPLGGCGYCTVFWIGFLIGIFTLGVFGIICPFISVFLYSKF